MDGKTNSNTDALGLEPSGLGLWLFLAYTSFGAWLVHSFAVKYFLLSIHKLLAKFS
jgi:hypothetical protein